MNNKTQDSINQLLPFDKINLILNFDDGLITSSEKSVLTVIAIHLGSNEFVWLSLSTLMRQCCLARDNITFNLKKLIKKGYLHKLPPSEGYKSCRYIINFEVIHNIQKKSLLVAEHYHTSSGALLEGERSTTSLVAEHYPNRNINKAKESKRKRWPRLFLKSTPKSTSKKQKRVDQKWLEKQTQEHEQMKGEIKRGMSSESRALWEAAMAKVKGKNLIKGNGSIKN